MKTWKAKQLELFDLSKDLGETQDLSEDMPEKTRALHEQMLAFLSEVGAETKGSIKK